MTNRHGNPSPRIERSWLAAFSLALASGSALLACGTAASQESRTPSTEAAPPPGENQAVAIFAGGCFWCMEKPFEELDGVISVVSGYTGGDVEGPSYHEVSSGRTGHAEAVRVLYDPSRVEYERLLEVFWHNIDPNQADAQFCDHGTQYRSGIFTVNAEQQRLARASLEHVRETIPGTIATTIEDADTFWVAEDYHQDYYRTHPTRYAQYRLGCGRDRRLQQIWGDRASH